jgi:hypothetical protein
MSFLGSYEAAIKSLVELRDRNPTADVTQCIACLVADMEVERLRFEEWWRNEGRHDAPINLGPMREPGAEAPDDTNEDPY